MKQGKSARVDNIAAELVQAAEETMIDILTKICNKIYKTVNCQPMDSVTDYYVHSLYRSTVSSARTTELSASSIV